MTHAPTNAGLGAEGGQWSDRLIVRTARVATWLAVTYRAWRSRQELVRLEHLDDRMLKDIGVERSDLVWARAQPWPIDATEALSGRVRRRRQRIRMLRRMRLQEELNRP